MNIVSFQKFRPQRYDFFLICARKKEIFFNFC